VVGDRFGVLKKETSARCLNSATRHSSIVHRPSSNAHKRDSICRRAASRTSALESRARNRFGDESKCIRVGFGWGKFSLRIITALNTIF
jgi:hypothetical protein